MTLNKGRNWAFIGVGLQFKICFRPTQVAEQNMVSMSPSILAFNFNLRVLFWTKIGYFEGWDQVQIVSGSTYIV